MEAKPQSSGPGSGPLALGAPQPAAAPAAAPAGSDAKESKGGFGWFLAKLVIAVLLLRTLVFSPFSIPSESMLPGLANGDYLLAAKWPYGFARASLPFDLPLPPGRVLGRLPERGDIVIFKHPLDGRDYVKRVIGLPGDVVALSQGVVILNGKRLRREARPDFLMPLSPNTGCAWGGVAEQRPGAKEVCRYRRLRETLPGGRAYDVLDFGPTLADDFAPITVPKGTLFVMGDNRDNSRDSRFPAAVGDAVGLVPEDLLVGRAAVIVWSTDGSAEWLLPWTWFSAARSERIGAGL